MGHASSNLPYRLLKLWPLCVFFPSWAAGILYILWVQILYDFPFHSYTGIIWTWLHLSNNFLYDYSLLWPNYESVIILVKAAQFYFSYFRSTSHLIDFSMMAGWWSESFSSPCGYSIDPAWSVIKATPPLQAVCSCCQVLSQHAWKALLLDPYSVPLVYFLSCATVTML